MIWKYISAGILVLTALAHSFGGYRSVLAPLLNSGSPGVTDENAILLRFTWHGLAVMMVFSAAVIAWPETPRSLVILAGIVWIAFGIADIVTSKFAHPGWIPMAIAGVLALVGAAR